MSNNKPLNQTRPESERNALFECYRLLLDNRAKRETANDPKTNVTGCRKGKGDKPSG